MISFNSTKANKARVPAVGYFLALTAMRPILFCLILALLSGCVTAAPPGVRIALGKPEHKVDPPSSCMAGYKSVEFPVRLTNASGRPIWIYAQLREDPSFRLYLRDNPTSRWKDETIPGCGVGADFHRIAPGESIVSTIWVPAAQIGRQLRIELPIYATPNTKARRRNAASEATPIR